MGIGASTEERSTEEEKDKMNSEMAKKKKGSRSKSRSESGESTKKEERGVLAGAAKTKEERKKSKTWRCDASSLWRVWQTPWRLW